MMTRRVPRQACKAGYPAVQVLICSPRKSCAALSFEGFFFFWRWLQASNHDAAHRIASAETAEHAHIAGHQVVAMAMEGDDGPS